MRPARWWPPCGSAKGVSPLQGNLVLRMQKNRKESRVLDYDGAAQDVPVPVRERATEYLRIVLKLLATLCLVVAVLFGGAYFLTCRPAQFRESNLLGKSIQKIEQDLGLPYYDSRSKDAPAGTCLFLVYTYGWGKRCRIEFNEQGIATGIIHYRK